MEESMCVLQTSAMVTHWQGNPDQSGCPKKFTLGISELCAIAGQVRATQQISGELPQDEKEKV